MAKNSIDEVVQLIIPPLLVALLTLSIFELFTDLSAYALWIDVFDIIVIVIFAIDLYHRWFEVRRIGPFLKKYWPDIIATIPFNLIFLGVEYLVFTRALRGVRIVSRAARLARFARYGRLLRLIRVGARMPRFLRVRKHIKKAKIRKEQPHEREMKGTLSFKVILLITINSIMGTGIYFLVAAGAKHSGPASLVSWALLSLIAVYIAMCFSELTAMFPKAGGVYEFAKQAYGRFWSFVIGWATSIAGSVTIAMLLLGALQYLIPIQYSGWYVPIAIGLIVVFNAVAYRGMQTSTVMLVSFALVTLFTVAAIIIPSFFNISISNFQPFFVFPAMNILLSIFFIAETFFGWESAVFLSAETKNPTKVMPKALIYGTVIIAVLAFALAFTSLGVIPWKEFGESAAPLKDIGGVLFGTPGLIAFAILVFLSIVGAVACWIVTAPRLLMSIAEDKLFFVQFAKIHPKYKSPYVSIIFQAIVVSFLVWIGAGRYETLLHMLIPLILFIYSAVLLSVVILRFRQPNIKRPYRIWFGKVGPLIVIVFLVFLLLMFIRETHAAWDILRISGLLVVLGIPAYLFIEIFYDDKYVTLRRNVLAFVSHYTHHLALKHGTFRKIVRFVGPFRKNTTLVDFNCGTGSFVKMLIGDKVPFKQVYAVDKAKEEIKTFMANIPKKFKKKIHVKYRASWSIPKHIKKVDVFVSFDALGHVPDIEVFLKDVRKVLKKGGRFCFHIKHHIMNVTPNAVVLDDKKAILKLFEKQKLRATYFREGAFTTHIFIYGKK